MAAAAPLLKLCSSAPTGGCTEATLLHSFSTTRINDMSSSAGVTIAAAAAATTTITTTRRQGRRELLSLVLLGAGVPALLQIDPSASLALDEGGRPVFRDLDGSGDAVKALDIREGSGRSPRPGDKVEIHYYARLAAKQGWRFDSTYDHKDGTGAPVPYVFTVGSGTVIEGLDLAVQTMKEGGVRRVIIPPSKGYQNTSQGPIPPNIFDRQRLFTTIFNPTRLANGEGSTLGTLIFDIELLGVRSTND